MSEPPDESGGIERTAPPRADEAPWPSAAATSFGGTDGRRYVPVAPLCEPRTDPAGRVFREVWKYRDMRTERDVAVKLVPTGGRGELIAQVERIGAALSADVPGIAVLLDHQVLDEGRPTERLALITQFIRGVQLDQAVVGLSGERALAIARALAECVASLHDAGIVHGDIKPGNVILRASDGKPVLVDAGSARIAGQPLLASSRLWEAPEAIAVAPVATREYDCWSLGLVIATLVGFVPDPADPPAVRGARAVAAAADGDTAGSDARRRLVAVISGLVNPEAGDRLQAEGALALIDAPRAPGAVRRRPRAMPIAVIVIASIALAAGAAYAFSDRGSSTHHVSQLVVFNKLVFGKTGIREDKTRAALSTEMRLGCQRLGCNVPGTQRHTGGKLPAPVCVATGPQVTNGSLSDPSDDDNPNLVASTKWYGVSDGTGSKPPHLRYISEVWVSPKQRGGLGLPAC